jgi:hypothetical protein
LRYIQVVKKAHMKGVYLLALRLNSWTVIDERYQSASGQTGSGETIP